MPRVLICASTLSHIRNFHLPYLRFFKEQGYEVHVAASGGPIPAFADRLHKLPITKSLISFKNLGALLRLRRILRQNRFEIMITHTALAGSIGRLAVLIAGKGRTKVIHTVHGYLFWNGCGLSKKILYRLPEWLLKGVTDCVVTMNEEDAVTALELVKKGCPVQKVPGMGVDPTRFYPTAAHERMATRGALSISDEAIVLVYAAEFSRRKNHIELIRTLPALKAANPTLLVLLCGTGALQPTIEEEVRRLDLGENVRFLGWCDRMEEIYKAADVAVSTSVSEGLPFNIIEAQLCGLPVVASAIRGHTDLIEHGATGWLYPQGDSDTLAETLLAVLRLPDMGRAQGFAASEASRRYCLDPAYQANISVYRQYMSVSEDESEK